MNLFIVYLREASYHSKIPQNSQCENLVGDFFLFGIKKNVDPLHSTSDPLGPIDGIDGHKY